MRTVTYDLRTLLDEAQRGTFVIPRFQREFVWRTAQVKLLVDSVSRNFPIGSLLLLEETNPQAPFLQSRPIAAELEDNDAPYGNERGESDRVAEAGMQSKRFYVLDGQQRLTSLVRVFLQASPKVTYYFDLQKLFKLDSAQGDWVVTRRKSQPMSRRFLRPEVVRDAEKCQILVEEYFENDEIELKGDRVSQRKASARVNRIFETMRNYQAPIVIIDRNEPLESICRIFETINSTGTRLTTFDLAVARFFPEPDLHLKLNESRERREILARYNAEGERILQVVAASMHMERGAYPEVTRSAILGLPRDEINSRWESSANSLAQAYRWVEEHGSVPGILANENLLVPLAMFFSVLSDTWKRQNPGCMTTLERWYFANSLQQGARQASNYNAAQNISQLCRWVQDSIVPTVPNVELDSDKLLNLRKADNRFGAIHALLRWKCPSDLWTGARIETDEVEDHHIFPASLARRERLNKRLLDSITNRILVSKDTNRSLGDQRPRDYMLSLYASASKNGTLQLKKSLLRAACIPTADSEKDFADLFDTKQFDHFLKQRAELILNLIAEVLGDALQSKTTEDQDDEE